MHGVGEKNRKGRPERSCITLEGNAIKSIVWGPNEWSIRNHTSLARVASKSDIARDGLSAKFFFEGTKDRFISRFFDEDTSKIHFRISEDASQADTCLSQLPIVNGGYGN